MPSKTHLIYCPHCKLKLRGEVGKKQRTIENEKKVMGLKELGLTIKLIAIQTDMSENNVQRIIANCSRPKPQVVGWGE